ncbi:MAG: penicillin acylase family protein [Nevskiales bacterium]|nr:penicillin acylase family protein [Nevskiales bacterium]
MRAAQSRARWLARWGIRTAVGGGLIATTVVAGAYLLLHASLPQLDGTRGLEGLGGNARIKRDRLGVVTLSAQNRLDLARSTGFVHGQERYFQMDLLRRAAAGELAELLGPAVLPQDRERRLFRMRATLTQNLAMLPDTERELLQAYTDGVNAGLAALASRPFEYWLLRQPPAPWQAVDSLLVLATMFFGLSDPTAARDLQLAALHEGLPPELTAFLTYPGTEWDAPLMGDAYDQPPAPPGPDIYDLRSFDPGGFPELAAGHAEHDFLLGSNNWAVAGSHVRDGGALVAGDMHLPYRVPHIWLRTRFRIDGDNSLDVAGVTLPGLPFMIVGSNGHVAWALTTTYGDWSDRVRLETDPADPRRYRTPDGWRRIEAVDETLRVRGADAETLTVDETLWGPVLTDAQGHADAIHWLARVPGALNLGFTRMERAADVAEAVDIANRSGLPPQNFVVGDRGGHIGWTVAGRIPRREGIDGRMPASWADGQGWSGFLDVAEYPRVIDPPQGRVWTANARIADGEALRKIGTGTYALGARQQQIRDDLLAIGTATETDMLAVQLDDRALLLQRWQTLLLDLLTADTVNGHPLRAEARGHVEDWQARAVPGSVGYRLVREWRDRVRDTVFAALIAPCHAENPDCTYGDRAFQTEGPLWALVTQQPPNLLNPRFETWNALLIAALDAVLEPYAAMPGGIGARSWGETNTLRMQHPLSRAVPALSRWLDMPPQPMAGDSELPRVQLAQGGASQRMAVTPGRERNGYFIMPGGQSGHPLSPYYRAGHADWMADRPLPFLPGNAVHVLNLQPDG